MDVPSKRKRELFSKALRILAEDHTPVTMSAHANAIRARARLARRIPDIAPSAATSATAASAAR
jgi:hypothetical protein